MSNILVVDDVKRDREMLAGPFRSAHDVRCVGALDEACRLLDKWWPDVALIDAMFPKVPNDVPSFQAGFLLDLIEKKSISYARRPQVILLSGQNEAAKKFEEVRSWLHDGRIADVIAKATADMGVNFFEALLQLRVENLLERRKWRSVQSSAESDAEWFRQFGIVTCSPKMLALRRDLEAAARSNASILFIGERGTGKTSLARVLHTLTRQEKRFLELNSANIAPALFESELFGIEGTKDHPQFPKKEGLLEEVADGTFLLDDIHNLAGDHQRKLNQVLQGRKFIKVNGKSEILFRARFVSATNENLETLVSQGAFRAELYDRINGFHITVPRLSERADDIGPLAENFLEAYIGEQRDAGNRCPSMRLHAKCFAILSAYEWPGNVRQLENTVKRLAAFAAGADTNEVEIDVDLLLKVEPSLEKVVPSGNEYDPILKEAGISPSWADLTETQAEQAIRSLLSDYARDRFEAMLGALKPRKRTEPGSPGRNSQDPATIHCLKALLYFLLRPEHAVPVQELVDLLQVSAWETGKKILNILAGKPHPKLEAAPPFAPFLELPEARARQVARLLPDVLRVPPLSVLQSKA